MTNGPHNTEQHHTGTGTGPGTARNHRQTPHEAAPRLERVFEAGCEWLTAQGQPDHVAVQAADGQLTYHELDILANQLARHLLAHGAAPGDRIGLLLDQGVDTYIAMLAVLKIQAVYILLNLEFSATLIEHLRTRADMRMLVSETSLAERLHVHDSLDVHLVLIDEDAPRVGRHPSSRLTDDDHGGPADELASLTYHAAPDGTPEGTEITHAKLCTFAITAAKLSGLTMHDRIYEGLSTTCEFSVEGIWVAWVVGATLFPKGPGPSPHGPHLRQFLAANRVTALYATPALLASLDQDLPTLRYILLSGDPCPSDLLARWRRPGRRIVSVYGTTPSPPPAPTMPLPTTARAVESNPSNGPARPTSGTAHEIPDDQPPPTGHEVPTTAERQPQPSGPRGS